MPKRSQADGGYPTQDVVERLIIDLIKPNGYEIGIGPKVLPRGTWLLRSIFSRALPEKAFREPLEIFLAPKIAYH